MVNSQLYETVLVSCSVADNMYLIVWIMIIGVDKKVVLMSVPIMIAPKKSES